MEMFRSVLSKVAWVGTASIVFGLALVLALILGLASTALSATGAKFILGKPNAAENPTSLVSTLNDAVKSALIVTNNSGGAALDLRVQAGKPPMKVNSQAEVANLNAALAGRADSAASADSATNAQNAANAQNATNAQNAANSDKLDDLDSAGFVQGRGKVYVGRLVRGTGNQIRPVMTVPGFATLSSTDCGATFATAQLGDFDQTRGTLSVWQDSGASDPTYQTSPPTSSLTSTALPTERTTWHLSVGTGPSSEAATIDLYMRATPSEITGTTCVYSATAQVWGR